MPVRQKTFRIEQMIPRDEPQVVAASGGASSSAAPNGAAPSGAARSVARPALQHPDVLSELKALCDRIEQRTMEPQTGGDGEQMTVGDLNKLKNETDSIHRAISRTMQEVASLHFGAFGDAGHGRASRELDAVVDSTERATQQILDAAESIDEAADTLSASLRREHEQALTSDIRDHVVRVFEACNFQDLSGQRIAKVLATLTFVEDRVARMLEIWGGRDALKDYAATHTERDIESKLVSGPKLNGDCGHVSQQEIDAMFA
jgi:chemotaxis protein CheZ